MIKYRILEVKKTSGVEYKVQKRFLWFFWKDCHYDYSVIKTGNIHGYKYIKKNVLVSFNDIDKAILYKNFLEEVNESFNYHGLHVATSFNTDYKIYYCVFELHFGSYYQDYTYDYFRSREDAIKWIDNNYPRKISTKVVS